MKNIDIIAIVNTYQKGTGEMALPASVSWTRRLNMVKLINAKRIIDEALQEVQLKYADDKHSDADEEGKRQVKPEYLPEFISAQNDILLQDTDIDIKKICIEALGDIQLTDTQMDTLAFMIEEGE